MSKVTISELGEGLYTSRIPGNNDLMTFEFTASDDAGFDPIEAYEKPATVSRSQGGTGEKKAIKFAAWGKDNRLPNHLVRMVMKNNLMPGSLDVKDQIGIGDDLYFYYETYENGKKIIVPVEDMALDDWLEESGVRDYMHEATIDYHWLSNFFTKFSKGNQEGRLKDKITKLSHIEAMDCRVSVMENGRSEFCGIADWTNSRSSGEIKVLPLYDPAADPKKLPQEFVVHKKKRTPGNPYYALPIYTGAQYWIRHANKIPIWKTKNMDNAANIKYHIEIPEKYFTSLYPDSQGFSKEHRAKKRNEKITEITDVLSGAENPGKIFYSMFAVDPTTGKELPGWKIHVLKNEVQHEAYSKDYEDANSAILSSVGVNPALSGVMLAGKMGAGSGSEIRTAYEFQIIKSRFLREYLLDNIQLAMKINGDDRRTLDGKLRKIYIGIIDKTFTTLDKNPTGTQNAA